MNLVRCGVVLLFFTSLLLPVSSFSEQEYLISKTKAINLAHDAGLKAMDALGYKVPGLPGKRDDIYLAVILNYEENEHGVCRATGKNVDLGGGSVMITDLHFYALFDSACAGLSISEYVTSREAFSIDEVGLILGEGSRLLDKMCDKEIDRFFYVDKGRDYLSSFCKARRGNVHISDISKGTGQRGVYGIGYEDGAGAVLDVLLEVTGSRVEFSVPAY